MFVPTDESGPLELVDLGDATVETKQVWFGAVPDSVFGLGFFRN
jgi:hypothetical protein